MPESEARRNRLQPIAEEMRTHNLTHGSGCKSTARAIAKRESNAVPTLQKARKEGQQTFCRWHRVWDWCETERQESAIAKRSGGGQ